MKWVLILCLLQVPPAALQGQTYPQAAEPALNEWKGLLPLRSTRSDVERLLGKPAIASEVVDIYRTETERVQVRYSNGPCEPSPAERWNVPKDVVILMEVIPQETIAIESLHLDPKKYLRFQESHPENWVQYSSNNDGIIVHSIIQGGEEYLRSFEYRPSAKDKALRCSTN